MPFPRKLLNSYETIKLDLHPHWFYLAPPASALVGSIVLVLVAITRDGDSNANKLLKWVALILLALCALWLVVRYFKWLTTNFVITSDRLIFRQGIIAKSGIQIPLERVNNVNFSQSIFERMIGAGDLLIESGGEDGQQRFTDIRHPDRVTNLIHEAMEGNEMRFRGGTGGTGGTAATPGTPMPPPSGPAVANRDVVEQIERLEGLLQRGSITPEEFEAQKRKLLG